MTDSNKNHKNENNYYNIDIYNDNSTGGDISSVFTTSFQSPLLLNPSHHEITVARARIPCDQIPLSQDNIPFQQWQIEIGVPVVGVPNQYTYYNSYVPQFLPVPPRTVTYDKAIIGLQYTNAQTLSIAAPQPTGEVPLELTPYSEVLQATLYKSPRLSTISYGNAYYYEVTTYTEFNVRSYVDNSIVAHHSVVSSPGIEDGYIYGICSSQSSGILYILVQDVTNNNLVMLTYSNPVAGTHLSSVILYNMPSDFEINSLSCN